MVNLEVTDEEAYQLAGAMIFVSRLEKNKTLKESLQRIADKISSQHLKDKYKTQLQSNKDKGGESNGI